MKKLTVACVILFLGVFVLLFVKNSTIMGLMMKCKTMNSSSLCIHESITSDIYNNPDKAVDTLVQIATLRRIGIIGGDFRAYSLTLHQLGSIYYDNKVDYDTLTKKCPALVKDGCIHGYVMEYYADNNLNKTQELCAGTTEMRLRLGCYHALGHSYTENTSGSLIEYSDVCKNIAPEYVTPCVSGVFHEYIRGGAESQSHHRYYDTNTPQGDVNCDVFSPEQPEYTICYAALGSFKQYSQSSEPIYKTKKLCLSAKQIAAKNMCLQAIRERQAISRGYSFIPK